VIGLTAAVRVQEAGLDVRVVTASLPLQTTSSVAAAPWYPYKAHPEDHMLSWENETFAIFEELSRVPGSGVRMRGGVEIWREPVPDPWWAGARCRTFGGARETSCRPATSTATLSPRRSSRC
jgi:D-amino-acid oxidase